MAKLTVRLSQKSIQENLKILTRIENLIGDNFKAVTEQLMLMTYLRLVEEFRNNKLENHISSIKYELINDGTGFKITCDDWVVFFNEYGTGVYNANGVQTFEWTYYKEEEQKFYTTHGQRPKFVWKTVKDELEIVAKDYYKIALNYALDQKSYSEFAGKIIV